MYDDVHTDSGRRAKRPTPLVSANFLVIINRNLPADISESVVLSVPNEYPVLLKLSFARSRVVAAAVAGIPS